MDESQNPEKESISSTYDLTAAASDLKEVCFGERSLCRLILVVTFRNETVKCRHETIWQIALPVLFALVLEFTRAGLRGLAQLRPRSCTW